MHNKFNNLQQLSQKTKDDDNNSDCLTYAFISMYKNSIWCIKSLCEFCLKSLSQILLLSSKEELYYTGTNKNMMMSMNNSADEKYSRHRRRHRRRLSKSISHHSNQKSSSKLNLLSNKTRVTVRSVSNLNLNQTQSNHTILTEEKNTLGTINSHIIVVPVPSSHCQNLPTNPINLREQLADSLCRRSYEPLTFMNRGMCCGHCRPLFPPNIPFNHPDHYIPQQQSLDKEKKSSEKSIKMSDASETQTSPYAVSPSIKSHVTNSPEEDELLTTDTIFTNGINEQNESIISFPDHDTSPSQRSVEIINDDSQLRLDAQILVNDSIQTAQEKYQRILRMSIDQDPQNNTLDTEKQTIDNQSKSIIIPDEFNEEKLSNDITLCQELCNKLNLSDSSQITEIIRILASNAPHILKEQSTYHTPLINNLNTNKEDENMLCRQLLLHPPFKPKRLIHLCPDGSIQVLSAVDDDNNNSNKNQFIDQHQQYHLNYSNSAITPSIQQNHILKNESSVALEYETTTAIDFKTNFNHKITTESTSTQQLHSKIPVEPIVKIKLDLTDETINVDSEDNENSLPEIFFKRIIAPESSIISSTKKSNQNIKDEKNNIIHIDRQSYSKSRYDRSRSSYTER
ncbi:unnamed protein product [Adineta steineri]|uniref:Uncharacterized protein n=1 Tax=Adineta steineri TaxID=433720 RepID=A0A813PIZ2_9BILA|nr:unnamed protein product [Adineta steineri]